jgi:RNA polymerase sigma-B factor
MSEVATALLRRRLRNSSHRLSMVVDRARAATTVPVKTRVPAVPGVPIDVPTVDADVWMLHVRFARLRDAETREALLLSYEGHARALAKRFYRSREPLDDLVQVAMEGLLVAIDRFDPQRRKPFLAFANPTIMGLLKHHYRDSGWAVRVPRRVHDLARPVREAVELLVQDLGRMPTAPEIGDLLGIDPDQVRDALVAENARSTASLDAPVSDGVTPLASTLGGSDRRLSGIVNLQALRQTLHILDEDDRHLLHLYYIEDRTQTEIAELLGVSQMQVSRYLSSAIKRLRSRLPSD